MNAQQKDLAKLIAGFVLYGAALYLEKTIDNEIYPLLLYLASYVFVGLEVLIKAIQNIARGQLFDENFLMALATIGAFAIGQYEEGVAVMLFYQTGELFQSYALNKSRKSIADLMDIRPDYANLLVNGKEEKVDPDDVEVGEIIIVKPGEKVPIDGTVINGHSTVDTKALTGESAPRDIEEGNEILSGFINLSGILEIETTKEADESTVAKILELVENAQSEKSQTENFITKFSKYYTPFVVFAALALAFIPPLVLPGAEFSDWLYRGLVFLVVSCPCALVISIPLGFFGGIGGASKQGILVKGSNYLEALANSEIGVFDKTGTLTKGSFKVSEVNPENITAEELLFYTAYTESYSSHPIAKAVVKEYNEEIDKSKITDIEEIAGRGIQAKIEGKIILAGNSKLMTEKNIAFTENDNIGTIIYVSMDNKYIGNILINDEIKPDAKSTLAGLKRIGLKKTVMLTGDKTEVGEAVAETLGLDEVYTELLPGDKVTSVEKLLKTKSDKGKLFFVGDGINDAPVLARADIGIAMGGLGSDAAIEAADIVIMTDELSKIITGIDISKKTLNIVKQNIVFALAVKAIVLVLGAVGISTMWAAVFADVGVAIIAILNAMRALNFK